MGSGETLPVGACCVRLPGPVLLARMDAVAEALAERDGVAEVLLEVIRVA